MAHSTSMAFIKEGVSELKKELEGTLYASAKEVRELRTPGSEDYANAILDENVFSRDTAEIYFYRFAPEGFPVPGETEFQTLMRDPKIKAEYRESCYNGWKGELQEVQGILSGYNGIITVKDMGLQNYLEEVEKDRDFPSWRVQVKFTVPGQNKLRFIRGLEKEIEIYERNVR